MSKSLQSKSHEMDLNTGLYLGTPAQMIVEVFSMDKKWDSELGKQNL